jgi:D-alanyl-lipoteichoic acid acyltransferase DltB (MBOAT superfamily)
MIFSSYRFIFLFLPITFAVYSILRKYKFYEISKLWLVLASLFFYAQGSKKFFPFFVATLFFNYFIGTLIIKYIPKKPAIAKLLLAAGLIENLGLLAYYKYTNFFIENVNRFTGSSFLPLNIVLPIGISFFTFQLIAFLVDSYKGEARKYSFINFLVFVTYFPQLIVGPIVHHNDIITQLENEKIYIFNPDNLIKGIFLFSVGCAKKILIADPLISFAQDFYSTTGIGGFFESWTAVLAYTFAYYFDFSGYGDMAVGLGLMFNIILPFNFDSPYKARNFAEFWRKWNITLSTFLNDYVFKLIYRFGDRAGKLFLAVMVTFVVSGIWHGAGWHFIFWGIANGILVCMAYLMLLNSKQLPFPVAWALTFAGSILVRVLFDSNSMTQAFNVYKSMFNIKPAFADIHLFLSNGLNFINANLVTVLLIVISAVICFGARNTREISEEFKPEFKYAALAAVLLTLSLFRMGSVSNFLYFQF